MIQLGMSPCAALLNFPTYLVAKRRISFNAILPMCLI